MCAVYEFATTSTGWNNIIEKRPASLFSNQFQTDWKAKYRNFSPLKHTRIVEPVYVYKMNQCVSGVSFLWAYNLLFSSLRAYAQSHVSFLFYVDPITMINQLFRAGVHYFWITRVCSTVCGTYARCPRVLCSLGQYTSWFRRDHTSGADIKFMKTANLGRVSDYIYVYYTYICVLNVKQQPYRALQTSLL